MNTSAAVKIARLAIAARRDLDSLNRALMVADDTNLDSLIVKRDAAKARYIRLSADAILARNALNA